MRGSRFVLTLLALALATSASYGQDSKAPAWDYQPSAEAVSEFFLGGSAMVEASQPAFFQLAGCSGVFVSRAGLGILPRSCISAALPAGALEGPVDLEVQALLADSLDNSVSVVWAPEERIARYGDEGVYPSYRFDVALVRITGADGAFLETPVHFSVTGQGRAPDGRVALMESGRTVLTTVEGFPFNGSLAMAHTLVYGLLDSYHGHRGEGQWALPEGWVSAGSAIPLETPVNLAVAALSSPGAVVITPSMELLGLVFSTNEPSGHPRSIAVDSRLIVQALKHIYGAEDLANEMSGASAGSN